MNTLDELTLEFEESPEDMRRVAEAIDRRRVQFVKDITLLINKVGLLHKMRFRK